MNRSHFWFSYLFGFVFYTVCTTGSIALIPSARAAHLPMAIQVPLSAAVLAVVVFMIVLIVGLVGVEWRRLHDLGVTGWIAIIALVVSWVPIINFVVIAYLVVIGCIPGNSGNNRYGAPDAYASWWAALWGRKPAASAQ